MELEQLRLERERERAVLMLWIESLRKKGVGMTKLPLWDD